MALENNNLKEQTPVSAKLTSNPLSQQEWWSYTSIVVILTQQGRAQTRVQIRSKHCTCY